MATINLWTREELILTLSLYLKLPFGKLDAKTKEVKELAEVIGRTSNAVSMRLNNFASVDPYHQQRGIKGLVGGIKQVQPIWDEFINNKEELLFESEKILAEKQDVALENKYAEILTDINHLKGEYKIREIKTRVNQNVFRQIVIANYSSKCAITGIDIPNLLIASHILPWSKHENERLNPENGICLSSLYDKAFDLGLISINKDFEVIVSSFLKSKDNKPYYSKHFEFLNGCKIHLPKKYPPNPTFLQFHQDVVFKK